MAGLRDRVMSRWRAHHARRWAKQMPPSRFDELLAKERDPHAAARRLDRLLLPELKRHGARTRAELAAAPNVQDFGVSSPAVAAWMESARRRRLIARCPDATNAVGGTLGESEWELTSAGASGYRGSYWSVLMTSTWKATRVIVPLAAGIFGVLRAVLGEDALSGGGLLPQVHFADLWDSIVAATGGGFLVGLVVAAAATPWTVAGQRRHYVANASRVLEREYVVLSVPHADGSVASASTD